MGCDSWCVLPGASLHPRAWYLLRTTRRDDEMYWYGKAPKQSWSKDHLANAEEYRDEVYGIMPMHGWAISWSASDR